MEQWKRGTKERSRRYVSEAYVQTLAAAAGISMITAFLFYRSVWGMCTFFVFAPLCLKFRQKREAARREVQIQKEFLTAMESVSGALMALVILWNLPGNMPARKRSRCMGYRVFSAGNYDS